MLHIKSGIAEPLENPSLVFPYQPDHFQNHSFQAIENGDHLVVTAHTGSGKTSVAEYAIAYGIKHGKKVIYTSPIKALSMQLYGDFHYKYPDWDLGIKTGDIDERSDEAQVVIMTTEILRNMLFQLENPNQSEYSLTLDEVSVVIFDEVHWIKDPSRGTVWEESIIKMPDKIQMIMLSATLPDAIDFAQWIADCKKHDVTYTTTPHRVIPLTHYVMTPTNKIQIMDNNYNFDNEAYSKALEQYNFNIVDLDNYLKRMELPALLFCFSRKHCQQYAERVTLPIVDSKDSCEIENQFDSLVRKFGLTIKHMQETTVLRSLLSKGVGYHHAGMLPAHKEIVQELFSRGLIQVLFVTETFAAGVNMPAKTVVFCGTSKVDSDNKYSSSVIFRTLWPEEYNQIAGRAGRRGKDTKGTVILMPFNKNYGLPKLHEAREMMCGKIKPIKSRFRMDYSYLLKNILSAGLVDSASSLLLGTVNRSLLASQDLKQHKDKQVRLSEIQHKYKQASNTLSNIISQDIEGMLQQLNDNSNSNSNSNTNTNKKYHKWIRSNQELYNNYRQIKTQQMELMNSITELETDIKLYDVKYNHMLQNLSSFLVELEYLKQDLPIEQCTADNVTINGLIAAYINEANPIMLTELIAQDYLDQINSIEELVSILAIFLPAKESDREIQWHNQTVLDIIKEYTSVIGELENAEAQIQSLYSDWSYCFEYCDIAVYWVQGLSYQQIKAKTDTAIYPGEFVRMMLKLNNICKECSKVAHLSQNDHLLKMLGDYQSLIIRDIVTPQSLYVG